MNNLRIADMAECEKPTEKLINEGCEKLSDAELLAVILRTGTKDLSVINLAQQILNGHPVFKGLSGLNSRDINSLMEIPGVGKTKASQILAVMEISRRMASQSKRDRLEFDSAESVADYFMEDVRYLTKEKVFALFLSSSNSYIHKILISVGGLNRSMLSPREIFVEALKINAASVILIHNHPSGDPTPSEMDILVTKKIKDLGDELGVTLEDHIIIGDGCYTSLYERGLL